MLYNGTTPSSPLGRCRFTTKPDDQLTELPSGPLAHLRRFLMWRVPWHTYYLAALAVAPLVGLSTHSVKVAGWVFLGLLFLAARFVRPPWRRKP